MTVGHKGIKTKRRMTEAERDLIDAAIVMRAVIGSPFGPGVNQNPRAFDAWDYFSNAELAVREERTR